MKVLIIGSGARESAIAWKYSKSKCVSGVFIAPGNAGTDKIGTNLNIDPFDFNAIIEACQSHKIDAVFVGPEAPLSAGIVDALQAKGIYAIGPNKEAAQLESSKTFSKQFMLRHNLPTAKAWEFADPALFENHVKSLSGKWVVKKNGLAAGKGVLESDNQAEMIAFGNEILKSDTLIIEEFLAGYEISVFVLSDGKNYIVLPPCSDFKKAKENDLGPNTGGMGSICPVPWVNSELKKNIRHNIIEPTMEGLKMDGINYKGIVYIGLMITQEGPKILEYNVRFGDPETQVLLPVIDIDFGDLTHSLIEGTIQNIPVSENEKSAVGVVIAAEGYPGPYKKNQPVTIDENLSESDALVFHASTIVENGQVLTKGGRCFSVVGMGKDTIDAAVKAYEHIDKVCFPGSWYRKDIGKKFFMDEDI
ncbi:MAG: phosphoribosylamine--glycine ligase [Spirochaetales bacterium]|nr:phosphoribosylamine--glycine ligase [Spirochaetales bacterium]